MDTARISVEPWKQQLTSSILGIHNENNNKKRKKKEEIWLSHMTKAHTPTEKIQKATWQHKNPTKNFDYTTIADRLRTVCWSSNSHTTAVVKPVNERSTFPLTATSL